MRDNIGIYIHIPFCITKCRYCDFNSYSGLDELREQYFVALKAEVYQRIRWCKGKMLNSVYFGGGTPTSVPPELITDVLETVRLECEKNGVCVSEDCEVTVECNPATIGHKGLEILRKAGFNRVSIGLQSTFDSHLETLGRAHTFRDFLECMENARNAGFNNISVDLMFGLPDQTIDEWEKSLATVAGLDVKHISCYSLKIEEGTPFYEEFGECGACSEETSRAMYYMCGDILGANGFDWYEISNFARNGFESRHNMKYWKMAPYLGFGAGAHSFFNDVRFSNTRDLKGYIDDFNRHGRELLFEESAKFGLMSEFMFLGLRLSEGVNSKEFFECFGEEMCTVFGDALEKHLKTGVIERKGDNFRIKRDFWYVSNAVMADFV